MLRLMPVAYLFLITGILKLVDCDQELTLTIEAGKEECFYETLNTGSAFELDYQVVDGGQGELDISFYLTSPANTPVIMDHKKPDNSHRVDVTETGPYRFCFDNRFSSFNRKTVFFALYSDVDDGKMDYDTATEEEYEITVAQIEDSVLRVKNYLTQIRHMQDQVRAWEARDRNVAESNYSRVNNWSILQIIVMLLVGFVQVIMVKSLFEENSRLNKILKKVPMTN